MDRPNPGQQLFNGEGLGDVVICSGIQSCHLVHGGIPGSKEDYRNLADLADPPQHLHAIKPWKHQIQGYQVILIFQGHGQTGPAV